MTEILFPCIERWHCIDLVLKNLQMAVKPKDIQILCIVSGSKEYRDYLDKRLNEIFTKVRIIVNQDTFVEHDKLRSIQYENAYAPDLEISVIKMKKVYETYTLITQHMDRSADLYWFIEDDTLFPLDTFTRYTQIMEALKGDIVTGISYYWHTLDNMKRNFWKVEYKKVFGNNDTSKEMTIHLENIKDCNDGVVRLGASGLGNVLAKQRAVMSWIPKNYMHINSGADISFFVSAMERNYKAYGICNLYLPHITKYDGGDIEIRGRIDKNLIPIIGGKIDVV